MSDKEPTPHKDCDDRQIYIGDRVAVQWVNYKELIVVPVIGYTKHRVRVDIGRRHRRTYLSLPVEWAVDPSRVAVVKGQDC